MSDLHVFPDVEIAAKDVLKEQLERFPDGTTVAVGGPPVTWTPSSPPHLEVAWDGTPRIHRPIAAWPTLRVVAWAATTSEAKRLAELAHAIWCAYPGGDVISSLRDLTGVLPARDPKTDAELAMATVQASVRSQRVSP